MEWYIPFNRLSPLQRNVLTTVMGNLRQIHWIRGCAGTGKTLLLAHLIERVASVDVTGTICFVTYTNALRDLVTDGLFNKSSTDEATSAKRLKNRVQVLTHTRFLEERRSYTYVFVDEVQDLPPADLRQIRGLSEHLILAGDPDQRIYAKGGGEESIKALVTGRAFELREVFRLTPEIRALAECVLERAGLVEADDAKVSEDFPPQRVQAVDEREEAEWVWKTAQQCAVPGRPSAILFPTHDDIHKFATYVAQFENTPIQPKARRLYRGMHLDYKPFNDFWLQRGVPLRYLGGGHGSLEESDEIATTFLMTYHSSKGLDFSAIFLPALNEDLDIAPVRAAAGDPDLEATLLFVAVTRSRRRLFLSYSSETPHWRIDTIDEDVLPPFDAEAWDVLMGGDDEDPLDDSDEYEEDEGGEDEDDEDDESNGRG